MDKTKSPGIEIMQINLTDCEAVFHDENADMSYEFALAKFSRKEFEDGLKLMASATFDLMRGMQNPAFSLTCSFRSIYSRQPDSAMTWDELKDHIVLAHMIPYVREFVSGVTLRFPLPALILPPTNTFKMIKEFESRQSQSGSPSSPFPEASIE
jgi:preprotein translocase subunit SecB